MQKPTSESDHDLAPLRIDARTWWKLEKRLGVSLGKWAREEIIAAADEFAIAQHFRIVDKTWHKLGGSPSSPTSISKWRTNLKRVLKNWGDIQNDPTAQQFFEDVSNQHGLGNVDDAMWMLRHLDYLLDAHLNPPKCDPFSRYVKRISGVYEKVMGKPAPKTIPTWEGQKASTFVEVMMTLNTALPDYAKHEHSTPAAWAVALYLARK